MTFPKFRKLNLDVLQFLSDWRWHKSFLSVFVLPSWLSLTQRLFITRWSRHWRCFSGLGCIGSTLCSILDVHNSTSSRRYYSIRHSSEVQIWKHRVRKRRANTGLAGLSTTSTIPGDVNATWYGNTHPLRKGIRKGRDHNNTQDTKGASQGVRMEGGRGTWQACDNSRGEASRGKEDRQPRPYVVLRIRGYVKVSRWREHPLMPEGCAAKDSSAQSLSEDVVLCGW